MSEMTSNPIQRFADGEMTGGEQAAMVRRVGQDATLARQVAHQQQLRGAVARSMAEPTRAPANLRARLAAIADAAEAETDAVTTAEAPTGSVPPVPAISGRPAVIGFVGRWAPAAVAAVLFLAALVTLAVQAPSAGGTDSAVSIIPAAQVERLARRHVTCTRSIDTLHPFADVPTQIAAIPEALAAKLGGETPPGLDLSSLGYQFDRVGPCVVPGQGSVHLIYKALPHTGRSDALSLWIVPDRGDLEIEADHVYTLAAADHAHPTLVWRTGGLVYYLVGDAMDAVQRAANQLAGTAASANHG